ncbi:hypothetical protein D9756_004451 [Leucocoprinus leucothites]|uniref:Nephrocystin 3-like N-terminal domain-containing protein n=1 Tax=Leucocoprinus leucothites TaxID=201217 RepID=A0A8H5LKN5_9AGAR|nr:hypothetical protein D9756_004451 [Leucoagaricus leucothites]
MPDIADLRAPSPMIRYPGFMSIYTASHTRPVVEVVVKARLLQALSTYHIASRSLHLYTCAWSSISSMSFFPHANNLVIKNCVFTEHPQHGRGMQLFFPKLLWNNYKIIQGIELLRNASRMEAAHDSSDNEFAADSLPRTRHSSILEDLSTWAQQPNRPFSSLWFVGPESNLAHLCADKLENYLAASFFFSRELGVDDPRRFSTTIAYQLALHFPAYEALIDAKLRRNPGLISKSLKIQFRELIAQPFQQLRGGGATTIESRQIIIINGLDECKGNRARQELLRILTTETEPLPFLWVVFTCSDTAVDGRGLKIKSTALPNMDAWRLMDKSLGDGCERRESARVWVVRLEGDGIWIILFGSMHKLAHWTALFFFSTPARNRTHEATWGAYACPMIGQYFFYYYPCKAV